MSAYIRSWLTRLDEAFWLLPMAMTIAGIAGAVLMVGVDRGGWVPPWLLESAWVYNGSGTGARTLLGAVAASTIGVAGTVFSITIAALSLAAGQMGPRLLRNFTRDRGVQVTLGAFLGTFSYALMVLRTVRTAEEGAFTPSLSLTVSLALAFVCVALLIYFVGHMAGRINVDTVIDLVSDDMHDAMQRIAVDAPGEPPPLDAFWAGASPVVDRRHGYLQEIDADRLANWAAEQGVAIRLLVRPGDYVFPGAPIAVVTRPMTGIDAVIRTVTALGDTRVSSDDIEFAIRQLVEVAVRALSPGINDPHTAISVLDRLGSALCELVPKWLPSGVHLRHGRAALVTPAVDYDGLADAMFHMIRQNAGGSVAVLARIVEVLGAVASCEVDPVRIAALSRHADLVLDDARRSVKNPSDLADLRDRHAAFAAAAAKRIESTPS